MEEKKEEEEEWRKWQKMRRSLHALRCAAICANRTAAKLLLASFIRGQDGDDDDYSLLGDDDVEDIGDNDVEEGEEEDNERDVEVEGGANLTAAKLPAAFLIRGRDSRLPATICAPIGDAFGTCATFDGVQGLEAGTCCSSRRSLPWRATSASSLLGALSSSGLPEI